MVQEVRIAEGVTAGGQGHPEGAATRFWPVEGVVVLLRSALLAGALGRLLRAAVLARELDEGTGGRAL